MVTARQITEHAEATIRKRLADYAEGRPAPKRKRQQEWVAPTLADLAIGSVLAFDQTFSKTGWVFLTSYDDSLHVVAKGVIKEPPTQWSGFEDTLVRALWMSERIAHVVGIYKDSQPTCVPQPPAVVHEMPAVKGYRPESSLLAALAVRQAASAHDLPVFMVSNTHMRRVLTPPGSDPTSKVPVRLAVSRYRDTSKGWNQDERDALALGLTFLYDRKKTGLVP